MYTHTNVNNIQWGLYPPTQAHTHTREQYSVGELYTYRHTHEQHSMGALHSGCITNDRFLPNRSVNYGAGFFIAV